MDEGMDADFLYSLKKKTTQQYLETTKLLRLTLMQHFESSSCNILF